jgi:hypothetical protein
VLGVSLLQAFTLEIGFFLFFLPYTMFYNWAYDTCVSVSLSVASNDAPWQNSRNLLAGRLFRPLARLFNLAPAHPFMVNCTSFCWFYS